MTSKDYQLITESLKDQLAHLNTYGGLRKRWMIDGFDMAVATLCETFAEDSELFDVQKFRDAIYGKDNTL